MWLAFRSVSSHVLLQFDSSEPIDFGSEASPLCFFSIAFVKHLVRTNVKVKTTIIASNASKTVTKTKIRAKTEKKMYSLPGQKHDPPEEVCDFQTYNSPLLQLEVG